MSRREDFEAQPFNSGSVEHGSNNNNAIMNMPFNDDALRICHYWMMEFHLADMAQDTKASTLLTGAQIIAKTLKRQNVTVVFGIVGIPVIEVAEAIIAEDIKFIGFRNEQSASYAASAYGYLTGRAGVCLVVGGPGVVHALAGVVNAQVNCWPLLLLAGSSDTYQVGMGAFQELDQVSLCQLSTKYSVRPPSISRIPSIIEKALRTSAYGRPGPVYVDLPADYIQGKIESDNGLNFPGPIPEPPKSLSDPASVQAAVALITNAKAPLIIIGKGASFSRGEKEILEFINKMGIPFLPTPMGKGVVPDSHILGVAAARSQALAGTDLILLFGARLNWILHFGLPPKYNKNVKVIQVDIYPEEHHNNRRADVSLLGHLPLIVSQLQSALPPSYKYPSSSPYLVELRQKIEANIIATEKKFKDDELPMSYHRAFWEIKKRLPAKDVVFVSEGANTMDIARSIFDVQEPRCRIDAGTFATMGVGMGFAIAAQVHYPNKRVVAIEGDSAFGFSAMEIETAIRAKLPLLIIIINNNGIYKGLDTTDYTAIPENRLPSTALLPDVRYELIAESCGGVGFLVKTPEELGYAIDAALAKDLAGKCVVVNVLIKPGGNKKLEFGWLQTLKPKI
ncbi:4348_t:CDS:10 [Ambispora gerdemannii]|uniref:2-hydroxyacyl-CoA lyase n=1 Tax=Ambispora gerdemannii TaxID=144530 RepID=A0A9N9CHN6_9GLOM|nr:4348_t:CDS:10 [Ambispora gerdemannii]